MLFYLLVYFVVGLVFLMHRQFHTEFFNPPVDRISWTLACAVTLLLWPLSVLFFIVIGIHEATGWLLEKIMG